MKTKPPAVLLLSLLLISILVCGGGNAALVNFRSDRVGFTLSGGGTYETTLPELPLEYVYDSGVTAEIWVKQKKVNGDSIGEVFLAYNGSIFEPIGRMDPGNNGWQRFVLDDPKIYFDQLHQGLVLQFEGIDEFATPTNAFYRLFNVSQVPVPPAAWLLGAGLLGLVGLRRRFSRHSCPRPSCPSLPRTL